MTDSSVSIVDSKASPRVSVVMAVYNNAPFLEEAVKSILDQTLTDFEFIIVDDGSTDGSKDMFDRFAQGDARVHVIHTQHQGVSAERNAALSVAKAPFIAVMDADDVSLPERFARQVDFLNSHPQCVAVGCEAMMIDPAGQQIGLKGHPLSHAQIDERLMRVSEAMTHPAVMIRAEALSRVGGYRGTDEPARDYDLFLRLAEIGELANLPLVLFRYRLHPNSISVGRMEAQVRSAFAAAVDAYQRRGRELPPELNNPDDDFVITSVVEGHVWRAQLLAGYDGGVFAHQLLDVADRYAHSKGGSRELRSRVWLMRARIYRSQGLPAKRLIAWSKAVTLWPRILGNKVRHLVRGNVATSDSRGTRDTATSAAQIE